MFGPAPNNLPTGARTLVRNPVFREAYREASDFVEERRGWSMWKELHNDKPPAGITSAERSFAEETVLQICTFRALKQTGVSFDAIAGMSLGDAAAGFASGTLTFQETLHVMCETIRGVLCAGGGDLLLVQAPRPRVEAVVKDPAVTIVFQWTHSTVWAVPNESARQAQRRLRAEKIPHLRLGFDCMSHTKHVDVAGLVESYRILPERSPQLRYYSTLEGGLVTGQVPNDRWARSISEPANLEAMWRSMRKDRYTNIIYIGSVPGDRDLFASLPDREKPTSYVAAESLIPLDESVEVETVHASPETVSDIETAFRSSAFSRDPYPFYRRWLNQGGVHKLRDENLFLIMGHDAAMAVLKQPRVFSSAPFASLSPVLPGADGELHTRVRRALTPYYTKEAINAQRDTVAAITAGAIKKLKGRRNFDAITELTLSVPFAVSCTMMGLSQTGAIALGPILPNDVTWTDIERAVLKDGMIPKIIANNEMSREDLMKLLPFLIGAGTLTVRDLLSFGLYTLFRFPHILEELSAGTASVAAFVDELLRFEPAIHGVPRRATEDTEVSGVSIPAQSAIWVWLGAANRDPSRFSRPDEFVMGRTERHIAFGAGPHFCIGNHLGRLEAEVMIEALVPHVKQLRPTGAPDIAFNDLRGGYPTYPLMRVMRSWQFAFKS